MKKMGWQPGEGLGKYKQGPSAPCEISMKTDRKGTRTERIFHLLLLSGQRLSVIALSIISGLAEQPANKLFKQNNLTLQKEMQALQSKYGII